MILAKTAISPIFRNFCYCVQTWTRLLTTVAHIGHPFIFFTLYICNSNFNRKNPSCVRFKICNSYFNRRNSSCVHFKICNSNFNRKNPSCVRFKICNSNFNRKIRVVCISKFATRIFTAKIRFRSDFHCKGSSQNSKSELCISKFTTRTFSCRHVVT